MIGNGARSLDRIKAPNHPARTVRKPPKPETRGSNPRGPANFQLLVNAIQNTWAHKCNIASNLLKKLVSCMVMLYVGSIYLLLD